MFLSGRDMLERVRVDFAFGSTLVVVSPVFDGAISNLDDDGNLVRTLEKLDGTKILRYQQIKKLAKSQNKLLNTNVTRK